MQKKLGGARGYLALEDLRIKFNFSRFNMPIREVGKSGERENPRGRRNKIRKTRAGRGGRLVNVASWRQDLWRHAGANGNGAMLYATSAPRLRRRKDLSANCAGAMLSDLGANDDGVKLIVYFLKAFHQGHI
jgi:hypothetical protein